MGGVMLDLEQFLDELADRIVAGLDAGADGTPPSGEWRLLSLTEVADLLGRSERWTRGRVKEGALPHVRLDGGSLRFLLSDVQSYCEARRVNGDGGER